MLAVNCRAYQAALILFDTIKRVANRDCINFTNQPSAPPSHTTVPFYDNVEVTASTSATTFAPDTNATNTEEKLTKVMNAWFSKDSTQTTTTPTQTTSPAPVITPLHSQTPTSFAKRNTDVDWLYSYSQQSPSGFNPASQQHFDPTKSESLSDCVAVQQSIQFEENTDFFRSSAITSSASTTSSTCNSSDSDSRTGFVGEKMQQSARMREKAMGLVVFDDISRGI